ncbi:uncharacterized protein LOC6619496 isoform X1 [Drosophila sechellia]|uniref:uncharacterized protein LOC6619496 isoform X1 n=1 Tax=Drosophila sechellia TaxID=7238 RepID=UPI0013DD90DF|nr:uncharacterized protein LOC6619496 isoform X1 [Drosophila sechellia]XP_032579815.1 uncharacterized protein LOC6619496 isoform X1 [Drosophila sechellia]
MDSTLNIEEKEIATKIGTQIDYADETKTIPQNNDNLNENQLESYIDSGFDKHVTSRDNEDDDDLKNEESESEDSEISEEKNTTNVEENPATLISKPSIDITSSDVERTVDIKDSESNNSIIIDASIKTDPSLSVENLPTVSENNLELDLIDGSTVGENSSNAENESTALDTSNILIKGEEDKAIEVCKSQYTKSSEEKNVNDPTSIANDLSTGNTKADLVLLNEPNVNDQTSSASDLTAENNKADLISQNKPEDFNSQILNIISDIDINIKAQEKITQLKEQELKLIQKQNDLANEIHKQQILAKQLSAQNQLEHNDCQSGELDLHSQYQNERGGPTSTLYQKNIASKEYANVSKTVDLRKIFTPATDAAEILPKNRKLYASSAFYSPTLHPTVEDQVELARRISHSLSDISNQTSKGQSMYVNRKKRSDKWVHEGRSQGNDAINPFKENSETKSTMEVAKLEKIPLKLIMNPNGKVRDYNSLKDLINVEAGLLSPDNCAELITALQLHQGRGAELFAKRRRKADNWVVDESHSGTQYHPSGIPDFQQYQQRPVLSPNILPAYSDAGKHRVQLNIHQNQLIEKYSKPGLQVVQSPWKAALQTGSASSAFLEDTKSFSPPALTAIPSSQTDSKDWTDANEPMPHGSSRRHTNASSPRSVIVPSNPQRDLAYTPCVAQGWGGRSVELPKDSFQSNESQSSWQTQPHIGRPDDSNPSFTNYIFGERLTSNFAFDVQNRLHSLENFQKYFLEYQRLEIEILRNRESARVLQPDAYESHVDFTPQNEFKVVGGEDLNVNCDLDEKVNVRELIQSFEKQNKPDLRDVAATIEGLYVPKEISLSSYAAPSQQREIHGKHFERPYEDTLSRSFPRNNLSANNNVLGNGGMGEFPPSMPIATALNTGTLNQQPYSPTSYKKTVPGLEKVESFARYEQPDRKRLTSGSPQYLKALQNSQVRNASPISFGTSLNEQTSWPPGSVLLQGGSPSPLPNHVQTFNKCAKGWGSIPVKQKSYSSQFNLPGNLPYSDF